MFAKIAVLFAILVAVNASGVLLHGVHPASKTVVSTHYAAAPLVKHIAPVANFHAAPLALHHADPLTLHHAAPLALHHGAPLALHHAAPIARHHAAPLALHHTAPVVLAHRSPVVVSHAAPIVYSSTVVKKVVPVVAVGHGAGHLAYNKRVIGHGLYGHRYGGVGVKSYNGVKSIHY